MFFLQSPQAYFVEIFGLKNFSNASLPSFILSCPDELYTPDRSFVLYIVFTASLSKINVLKNDEVANINPPLNRKK